MKKYPFKLTSRGMVLTKDLKIRSRHGGFVTLEKGKVFERLNDSRRDRDEPPIYVLIEEDEIYTYKP